MQAEPILLFGREQTRGYASQARPLAVTETRQTRRRFASSEPNENSLSLPPQRFQVYLILFYAIQSSYGGILFFIFHSHYLFAIGLS